MKTKELTIFIRLGSDKHLKRAVVKYAKDNNLSENQAAIWLLKKGLEKSEPTK